MMFRHHFVPFCLSSIRQILFKCKEIHIAEWKAFCYYAVFETLCRSDGLSWSNDVFSFPASYQKGRQEQLKRQRTKQVNRITRRQLLKSSAVACAFISAPTILSARVLGAEAPSNRITIGMIGVGRQAYYSNLRSPIGLDEIHLPLKSEKRDFTDAVKTRGQTLADAEVGHRTNSPCQIGHIAIQLGRKLQWDPDAEKFINDDTANRLLSRPMRSPWRV